MVRNEFFCSNFGESVTSSSIGVFRPPTGRHRRRILFSASFCQLLAGLALGLLPTEPGYAQAVSRFAPPQAADRIAIIAPHPDDEILGASGLIQQAVAAGAPVKIIYLTNGDHNQAAFRQFCQRQHLAPDPLALGEQRRAEAVAATTLLGLRSADLVFLGYPDWWTLRLWQDYWDEDDVLYNNATGSTGVPYQKNYSYQHPYRAECVTDDLCAVLREFKPTRVFVSHPCDTNPDHRAAANFVRLALLQLETEQIRPALDFYIVHFGDWPTPLQYSPNLKLDPPPTLCSDNDWESLPLTLEQVERKHRATLTNLTQIANAPHFLEAFARANEVFAMGREPLIPLLSEQTELDWAKATHLRALPVLPSECGHDSTGIAALPAAVSAMDLKCIDFIQQADALLVQVELKNLGSQRAGVRLYLFGYKQGVDFADLPKVQITISPAGRLAVLVDLEAIEDSGVTMISQDSHLILRVPLKLLGGPDIDHLFTTARAYLGAQIADDIAWHLLRFEVASKS